MMLAFIYVGNKNMKKVYMENENQEDLSRTEYIVRKRGRHEGRPIEGLTRKELCSIRIQAHIIEKIKAQHGTIQKWIDLKSKEDYERK